MRLTAYINTSRLIAALQHAQAVGSDECFLTLDHSPYGCNRITVEGDESETYYIASVDIKKDDFE